jgi:transcriptional regulator with GAF, ATPase, and Fis domain
MSESPSSTTVRRPAARGAPPPAAMQMMLHVVFPPERAAALLLQGDALVVGRDPAAAGLVIADATISRRHLAIDWHRDSGAYVARDLGSRNGSAVDGVALGPDPRPLAPGSVLRIGDVLAVYEQAERLQPDDAAEVSREAVPGEAAEMRALRVRLVRAAADPAPVLLIGESGTGKERIAAEVHRLSGRRGRLVAVNCAALSRQLIESQLFGHVKGAFTGATEAQPGYFRAAQDGTLFLDEVGELPLDVQPKLLRALQQGEVQPVGSPQTTRVDVRVVAATNRQLGDAVTAGHFRADLYARLALWELRVPPLRDRRPDLLAWIDRLHTQWRQRRGDPATPPLRFDPDAAAALLQAPWPLNLRGLERLIHELAATGATDEAIPVWRLPAGIASSPAGSRPPAPVSAGASPVAPARAAPASADAPAASSARAPVPTREEFVAAYESLGGSVRGLAKHFGRDRRQIYRWITAYGLKGSRE